MAPRTARSFALCALAIAALRCAPEAPTSPIRAHAAPVYWGEDEDGYDGVVRLTIAFDLFSGAMCSGTLVSSRVIVTAEHCVLDEEGALVEPSAIVVETGPAGTRAQYRVEEIRIPEVDSLSGADFAVVITEEEVEEPPFPYTLDWQGRPGDPITLVGYGQREDGSSGRKARGDNEVGYVFDTYFTTTGEAGCHGDSGGPAFDANGVLVGVIVNTLGGWVGEDTCLSGVSGLTRVDSFHDLVDGAIEDSWVCGEPGAEEICGNGRDEDCDFLIDDGCLALGEACSVSSAFTCASGDCRDLGDGPRCTLPCALGLAGECPVDFYCDAVACGEGACVPGVAGGGILGSECALDTDCAGLSCLETAGGGLCLRACGPDAACGAGEDCADVDGDGCGGCLPPAGGRPFAAPCENGGDCASGLCVLDGFGAACSAPCEGGCPDGFTCDADDRCVRPAPAAELGSPCADAAGCASGSCEEVDGRGRVCTAPCEADGTCPGSGLACVGGRCEPAAGLTGTACADGADCVTGLCGNFDDFRACTAECGLEAPCPGELVCQPARDDGAPGYCRPREAPPPLAAPAEDDGGCGCRQGAGSPAPATGFMVGLAFVALLLGRPRTR